MRLLIAFVLIATGSTGCTAVNLQRYAIRQSSSLVDLRYQQVVDNFATFNANTGKLPALALTGSGVTTVTNNYSWDETTGWSMFGLASQSLNLVGKHTPNPQWTVEPLSDELQLRAVRAAYVYVLCGEDALAPGERSLLDTAKEDEIYGSVSVTQSTTDCDVKTPAPTVTSDCDGKVPVTNVFFHPPTAGSPHFDVLDALSKLPSGWLKCGCRRDAPTCACYCAECCGKYVWVEPDGMPWLSQFTLIMMDIATRDVTSVIPKNATVSIDINILNSNCVTTAGGGGKKTYTRQCFVAKVKGDGFGNARYMAISPIHYGPPNGKSDYEVIGHGYLLPYDATLCCDGASDAKVTSIVEQKRGYLLADGMTATCAFNVIAPSKKAELRLLDTILDPAQSDRFDNFLGALEYSYPERFGTSSRGDDTWKSSFTQTMKNLDDGRLRLAIGPMTRPQTAHIAGYRQP